MASFPKVATDFDAIIQADRQRRKNEDLAKEIFGRSKQKDNKKKDDKRPSRNSTPSLASRVGIAKRSSSTSSNTPSPRFQNKPRTSLPNQNARVNRLANELDNELIISTNLHTSQPNTQSTTPSSNTASGSGISIRGASGPFVLHASNFAPGTTAADIESALHPDTLFGNGISSLASCKLVSTRPDVVAELVFTEKSVADNIIAKYNGQKADGRILRVELVRSGVGAMNKPHNQPQSQPQQQISQSQHQQQRDRQPKTQIREEATINTYDVDIEPEMEMIDTNAMEDIEMDAAEAPTIAAATTNFNDEREAADRDRRDRDSRRDRDEQHYDGGNKRRGKDDRRRNDRDRDRERDSGRDRDRDRDRERNNQDRDRGYERRGEERRGTMSSHYGNGVGGGGGVSGGGGIIGVGGPTPSHSHRGNFNGGYGGEPSNYRGGRYDGGGYGRGAYRGGYRGYR